MIEDGAPYLVLGTLRRESEDTLVFSTEPTGPLIEFVLDEDYEVDPDAPRCG